MLQLINGVMFLVVNFILTVQSADVLEIVLNLTGLVFLQEIDDLGFHFASMGILGESLKFDCDHVSNMKQIMPKAMKARIKFARRFVSVVAPICLLIPYWVLSCKSCFLPNNVYFAGNKPNLLFSCC